MVFESLVANLLNKYLSEFVDELTAKQLNLFAWNGNISLENIAIKSNAFDSLSLPFRVTHGHIARIEASFPWKSIYSSPVVIKLSDVYVVAVPNSEAKYDDIKEELIEWNDKQKQLEKIEDAKLRSKESNSDDKKTDDSFGAKLAAQIVKNLQVFITNVHICYEDQISWPKNPFQVGLTLHKLVFETQNEDQKKNSKEDIIYKLVTLEGLSFYWNCKQTEMLSKLDEQSIDEILAHRIANRQKTPNDLQYILWPINFTTNAIINRKPEVENYSLPVLDIEMDLDVFELRMTRMQFESLLLLLDAIDRMNLGKPYRKWRPSVPIKGHSKNWWRFAFNAIIETDIKRRINNWSWNMIRKHRTKMNRYQQIYKQKLLSKNIDSIKTEIESLEKDLNLFSIVLARNQAEVETQQILKNKKEEPKKGWFSGWFSKEETKVEENIVNEFKKEMNTKEKQKLYEAIGYEEGIPEELPKDFIAHKIKFLINKLFITISDENNEKITQLSLLGVGLDLTNRPSSHCLCISNSVKSLYISGVGGIPLLEEQSTVDVLSLEFDMNPLNGQYDYGIIMRMSGFKLMYDSNTIQTLVEMLSPPQDISLEDLQLIAAYKFQDFTQRTATGLEYAIGKHKQIKLNVDIEPSYVIIPQLGQMETAHNILLLSLGHVKLSSQLIPKTEIPTVRDLISSHSDYELILKMRKMAYESYKCHISEVQMILSDVNHWQSDMKSLSTTRHLLYPVEFNLTVDRSIVPNDQQLAKIKVEGHLPNIELKISDKQLTNLMNLLMTLPFGSKTQDDDRTQEDIDGSKPLKVTPRSIPTIESSKIVSAAIDLVKERLQLEENIKNEGKDAKEESDGNKSIIAYKSVIFDFKLKEILVSLFQGPDRSPESAIAVAKLNKFEISGDVLTDTTLTVTCYIGDLCLNDVRTTRSNAGIKTLFERNQLITSPTISEEKDSIFSISFTQKSNERLIVITISGFRLILALDYLLNLSNIITKAFDSDSNSESIAPKKSEKLVEKPMLEDVTKAVERAQQLSSSVQKTEVTNILHFNLNQMEIVLLESIEVITAPAIVMGCHSSINLIQNPNHIKLYGEVSQISALLTNYERYISSQEIDAYIMRPTNLNFNGTLSGDELMLDITFSEIQFFISPPMVNIVLNILSKMGSSTEKEDSVENEESNPLELFKIRANDIKKWYLSYVPEAEEVTENFVDTSETPIISTKQQIYLNIKSISFIIESGGLDSEPLIKMNSYFHGKLVGYKSLSANCSLIAEYYNENNFFWEPLIEPIEGQSNPWDFQIKVLLEENGKIDVKLESNEQLEMTITKTSIDVLSSLNEAFANAIARQLPAREDNVVIVRNFLGIDLRLFLSNSSLKSRPLSDSTKVKAIENETILIKTGDEMSLIANDIKEVELNVGLLMADENEILRRITCHGHVLRCYNLPKKTYPTNEFWKWIVEVEDKDAFTKTITFKSNAQIVNQFNTTLDIFCLKREKLLRLGRVKPLSILELPLDAVYGENCELKVKPSDDYGFSDKIIDWRNAIDRRNSGKLCLPLCETSPEPLILVSQSENNPQNKFHVKVRCDNKEVLFEDTNTTKSDSILHQIKLIPIVKLKNLLPFRITYATEGIDQLLTLEQGEETDLSAIKLGETGIAINLIDYLERDWHCFRKIPSHGDDNDIHLWKFTTSSYDRSLSLDLAVKLSIETHSLIVSLFAPFWMINRTSQQLVYRIDDETVLYHAPTIMSPVLLSFNPKSFFCKKKLCLSIGDSKFSDGFSIDVVGSKGNIVSKSKNGKYNYYVSVDIQLSRIGLSKIVTISPFYSIINISKNRLEISEDNDEWFRAESMNNTAFWPKQSKNQSIYLRLNSDSVSSKPLSLSHSSSTLIRVDGLYLYVDIDISEWDGTIKISDYFEGSAPVMLVNALNGPITFGQKGVAVWSSKTGEQKYVNTLPSNHSVLYTWYLPSAQQKLVWKYEDLISEEQTIDFKCDLLLDVNNIFVVSFLDGKQRVLLFTNDGLLAANALQAGEITKPKINVEFVMKGIGLSIVNNEAKKDLLYIAITSSILWEIREPGSKRYKPLAVKQIDAIECLNQKVLLNKKVGENISFISDETYQLDFTDCQCPKMISPKSGQLRRLANRGIWIAVAMSEHIIQCHMKVNRLQIDNQMSDHIFGIVMCPIAPPKTVAVEHSPKSFIEFSTVIEKQPTITRFKYNSILIQEFLIQIDRGLLSSIQELLAVAVKKESNKKLIDDDITDILQKNRISDSLLSSRKSYYDNIHFSPLKVHVSFSLGGASGGLDLPLGLDFIVRSAGVTLTEFNDVVFRLDYFERKNLLVENSELMSIVINHYTTQVLKQFYKLVLGLDLIGNPMKLVLGLKEGVGDFFYEPFQGIIQGPGEFAEGIQIGVKSLASNVVGGAAGALGSITNTLGEGVSALTMDDKFRRERRSRLNRKVGFAESGKNLFKGVFAGVTGVITQPIEGAREDGFEGLFKGVGKGVVGIVAQPTTGIIDFTSGTLNALKRAVDPKQEAKQMRPPRTVGRDGKLRPYNRHYAIGRNTSFLRS